MRRTDRAADHAICDRSLMHAQCCNTVEYPGRCGFMSGRHMCEERTFRVYDGPRFEKDLVNAWALQMHMPRARHVRAFI